VTGGSRLTLRVLPGPFLWEADFPHNDSNWPNIRKVLSGALADVPGDEAARIAEQNARALYRFPRA
jgi:predicted TIM-barrel fold metal-dependent hydrolase